MFDYTLSCLTPIVFLLASPFVLLVLYGIFFAGFLADQKNLLDEEADHER